MKTAHQSSGDQALNRALDLLKAVITDDGRQPASRLAAALDLAPSTARRMMASLCRHGLVERIGHGHYAAGPGLAGLAAYTRPHRKLIEAARPLLRALAREEKLTAHLGLFQNDMVTYLVKEGGGNLFTQESAQLEAYCTGIGKALLARLPDAELEHYLKGNFIALTPYTLTTPEALRKEIKQVRGAWLRAGQPRNGRKRGVRGSIDRLGAPDARRPVRNRQSRDLSAGSGKPAGEPPAQYRGPDRKPPGEGHGGKP